jgi:outer membrane lipoprotein-sorting protein
MSFAKMSFEKLKFSRMKSAKIQFFLILVLTTSFLHAQDAKNGLDVFRAMHDRYAKTWYKTLTFTQKSTTYNADGTKTAETWYEALAVPGKLRIDIGPPTANNGYLMIDGTLTIFHEGKEPTTRPQVNMLLVLGFDVYCQPAETTANVAKAEAYDLTKVHEETWEGHPVYVVGADKGDFKSRQFWVDKNRLLFVRLFEPLRTDPTKFREIRFEDYRQLKGGWVSARVEVYAESKETFSEEYSDIVPDAKLDPATFDPKQYTSTHWEKQ